MLAAPTVEEAARSEAHRKAREFIENEQQFHLGALPTEQSNPKTCGLAETAQRDIAAAVRMLQAVDADVLPKAEQVFAGQEFPRLVAAMQRAIDGNSRICFSGCGATGRLSILLEAAWRGFCVRLRLEHPDIATRLPNLDDRAVSIMTGGDYALIRSVENFEDYQAFGRQQARGGPRQGRCPSGDYRGRRNLFGHRHRMAGAGKRRGSILRLQQSGRRARPARGTFAKGHRGLGHHEARSLLRADGLGGLDADASHYRRIARGGSRAGDGLGPVVARQAQRRRVGPPGRRGTASGRLRAAVRRLVARLGAARGIEAIAAMVQFEDQLYRHKGLVTYMADECLLDIFTDTTERSPTFMLPKFRTLNDTTSPRPWAFVKDPLRPTSAAWAEVLHRPPRCLDWDADLYRHLDAPAKLQANPPKLSAAEMFKFAIGNEPDPSRYDAAENAAVLVVEGVEASRLAAAGDRLRRIRAGCAAVRSAGDSCDRSRASAIFLLHLLACARPSGGLAVTNV